MSATLNDGFIKECPHGGPPQWLCDDCLASTFTTALTLSERNGLPPIEGVSDQQIGYATYVRWRAVVKNGAAIDDLVRLERQAEFWLDNRTAVLRGSLNGKLGSLLEQSQLRESDPAEARRRELTATIASIQATIQDERRKLDSKLAWHFQMLEKLGKQMDELDD